jgi:hypothetical protein
MQSYQRIVIDTIGWTYRLCYSTLNNLILLHENESISTSKVFVEIKDADLHTLEKVK